tara:strand:+ start:3029 stop:3298 length:270 start_codon:yes stop_codon:yes gene_type:complete
MENGILPKNPPVKEAIKALEIARDFTSAALNQIKSNAVGESISDMVHMTLYMQTSDTLNGLNLCIATLEESLKQDQLPTIHPSSLNLSD